MKCPRCSVELKIDKHAGIEVDKCPQCDGLWLDHHEMDQLEDTVMDDDRTKGTMFFRSEGSDLLCPRCESHMQWFRYRHYDVELDYCEQEHGFWLDKGEEKKVVEIMGKRIKDLKRSASAEAEWGKFLSSLNNKSFTSKLKGLFKK